MDQHLVHPRGEVSRLLLQPDQVGQNIGVQYRGQLLSGSPTAERLHCGAQDPLGEDGRCGIGSR